MIPLVGDTQLKLKELARWTHNETKLIILEDQIKSCYTMRLYKYDKLISESTDEENNLGKLLCLLLDRVPIDPKHLKLN